MPHSTVLALVLAVRRSKPMNEQAVERVIFLKGRLKHVVVTVRLRSHGKVGVACSIVWLRGYY
jgi:hypothetical protein